MSKRKSTFAWLCLGFIAGFVIDLLFEPLSRWRHFGTLISAFIGGPIAGVLVGAITAVIQEGFSIEGSFSITAGSLIGVISGLLMLKGFAKKIWKPFIIFIISLVIASLSTYFRWIILIIQQAGITTLDEALAYFQINPMSYVLDAIKTGIDYAIPMFLSVYISWLLSAILATTVSNFRYKDKYVDLQDLALRIIGRMPGSLQRHISKITPTLSSIMLSLPRRERYPPIKAEAFIETGKRYYFGWQKGYRLPEERVMRLFRSATYLLPIGTIEYNATSPKIFNITRISKRLGISRDEVEKRLKRMFDDRLLLTVSNVATQQGAFGGFGLYYLAVKLKKGAEKKKRELSEKLLEEDLLCTSFEGEGDFDFFVGTHISTLDKLRTLILNKYFNINEIEEIILLPVQRLVKDKRVFHWDAPLNLWLEYTFDEREVKKLLEVQNQLDETDIRIVIELNKAKSAIDKFNLDAFGRAKDKMQRILSEFFNQRALVVVSILNWMKLNINPYVFFITFDEKLPSDKRVELVDKFCENPAFFWIYQHNDSQVDCTLMTFEKLWDIKEIRSYLKSFKEVSVIKEMRLTRQYRQWAVRMDDKHWGESKMMFE